MREWVAEKDGRIKNLETQATQSLFGKHLCLSQEVAVPVLEVCYREVQEGR